MICRAEPSSYLFSSRSLTGFPKHGALAQLGERLICIQEVSGSIPLGSTIFLKQEDV